jgi:hypothetical protein
MPWYGWYSAKQEKIYGYAHYQNKKGILVCITKISKDQNLKHPYSDSIYQGELTHYIEVKKWNSTKKNRGIAYDSVLSTMKYEHKIGDTFKPKKIIE